MKTSNCSKKIPFFLLFFDEGWYPPLFSNSWGGVERWMGGVEGGRGEGVQRRGEGHFSSRPVIRGRGRVMALLSPYTLPNHSHFSPPTHLSCYFPFLFIFLFLRSMCILYSQPFFPQICLYHLSPSPHVMRSVCIPHLQVLFSDRCTPFIPKFFKSVCTLYSYIVLYFYALFFSQNICSPFALILFIPCIKNTHIFSNPPAVFLENLSL